MWIASLFSDQYAKMGELGSTGISYMTLSGTKESGTDIHTVTANAVGVDRNSAKILNYARIYLERFEFFLSKPKNFRPFVNLFLFNDLKERVKYR